MREAASEVRVRLDNSPGVHSAIPIARRDVEDFRDPCARVDLEEACTVLVYSLAIQRV